MVTKPVFSLPIIISFVRVTSIISAVILLERHALTILQGLAEKRIVMELMQSQFDQLTPADDVEVVDPELPIGMLYC